MGEKFEGSKRRGNGVAVATDTKSSVDGEVVEDIDNSEITEDRASGSAVDGVIEAPVTSSKAVSATRRAIVVGLVVIAVLAALVGWSGFRLFESHRAQALKVDFCRRLGRAR